MFELATYLMIALFVAWIVILGVFWRTDRRHAASYRKKGPPVEGIDDNLKSERSEEK